MNREIDLEGILNHGKVIEEKEMIFEVDERKAFLKLAENQFDDPFDGIRELIANAIDSYDYLEEDTMLRINKSKNKEGEYVFSIQDYGSGMDDEKINFLRTLGLSDKSREGIGRFGIGFASIFNPKLGVKRVLVDTNRDGKHQQIVFDVKENAMPSMNAYEVKRQIKYSTKISLFSNYSITTHRMMRKAKEMCAFLPYKVMLNGKELPKAKLSIGEDKGVNINEKGIKGYIEFHPSCYRVKGVGLLSHYLPIEEKKFEDFKDPKLGKLYIPYVGGAINNNSFNPVLSRNEVIDDAELEKVKEIISSKGTSLLSKLVDYYNDKMYYGYQHIILENISNLSEKGVLKKYLGDKEEIGDLVEQIGITNRFFSLSELIGLKKRRGDKEYPGSVKLLEKIVDARVFELWEGGYISLREINERIGEKGFILATSKEETASRIDDGESRNILIQKEQAYGDNKIMLSKMYRRLPFIDLDKENPKSLARKGVKLRQPAKLYDRLEYDHLTNNQRSFLDNIKKVLDIEEVKETRRKYDLPGEVNVEYSRTKETIRIASYAAKTNTLSLNPDHSLVKRFVKYKNHEGAALYFIPLLSHELIHDKIQNHLENFYRKNTSFDTDMRMAIANYKTRGTAKKRIKSSNDSASPVNPTNPDSPSHFFSGFFKGIKNYLVREK